MELYKLKGYVHPAHSQNVKDVIQGVLVLDVVFSKSFSVAACSRASMKDLYAGFMGPRHRKLVWEYKKLGVGAFVGGFRVTGWVLGKLSHHLFIQSTEVGVSGGKGLPSTSRPGNTSGQELFF